VIAPARGGDEHGHEPADPSWDTLHPRMVTRWRLDLLGTGLTLAFVAGAAELTLRRAELLDGVPRGLLPAAIVAVTVIAAVVWPPLVYRRWSYRLGDDALEIRRGVIVHRTSLVPYRRVQQVDLSRGPVDRLLGLVSADLTTAAATSDGSVPGLAPDVAETFRQVVLERAGRDDAV
jgi:membrane protein YdbS with pleckstrin-like domain